MSIISGKPYKILHRESRLALDLSKDHKSILGEHNEPVNTQTWIPEFVPGGVLIKSKESGLYIGFEGTEDEGKELISVDRDHAKVWDIERNPTPDYLIKLKGTHFAIEFPTHDVQPGIHARLGVPFLGATNQIWVIILV